MNSEDQSAPTASLLDYLRLFRIPNVFTSLSDIAMGFCFIHPSTEALGIFGCLLLASALLYTAGMVLNDVYDVEVDRQERPHRPIPSGKISLGTAKVLGYGMLLGGVGLGWLAGFLPGSEDAITWRSGAVATILAACVVLYDAILKKTPLAPIAMGSCRFFNVLLGMSAGAAFTDAWNVVGFGVHHLIPAAGIGLYIVGVTWFARTEARESSRVHLALATATQMAGIAILGLIYQNVPANFPMGPLVEGYWWMLLGLLAFTILRRCSMAINQPVPQQVQMAVKHSILSLIVLDAAVTLVVSQWYFGLAVLALLIPTVAIGKWVYST